MIGRMPLLVDCYNMLYTDMPQVWAGLDESGLCQLLGVWPDTAVVVCDGTVKPGGPDRSPVEGVELVYAGRARSADDWIINRIDADTAPRRLTVVSSDRRIQKAARRRRCRVLASAAFLRQLATACARKKNRGRADKGPDAGRDPSGPLNEQQVRRWLEYFGVDTQDDRDNPRRL